MSGVVARLLRLTPYDDVAGWWRGLGVTLAAALFLSLSGAFTSGVVGFGTRLAYWLVLMLAGWLWGSFIARLVFRGPPLSGWRLWARAAALAAVIAAPFCGVVALASHIAFGASFSNLADLSVLFLPVFTVSLGMVALNVLLERRTAPAAAGAAPVKFLERLPLKLRGAEVWAIEAEDHYLRLHTSKGQDLILMRLSDAIAELGGVEGAQVHRSWWVARDAIADVRRADGRATLTLKNGAQAPVSRTYAGVLRDRGWI